MWYFQELPSRLIKTVNLDDDHRQSLFDTSSDFSISSTLLRLYSDSLRIEKYKAVALVKKYTAALAKRSFVMLEIPVIPAFPSFPRLYDPQSKGFIMILGF